MSNKINGYLVVRKSLENFDSRETGPHLNHAPRIGELVYMGVDRMPWADVSDAFYSKRLPEALSKHFRVLQENKDDLSGLNLTCDIDVGLEMLRYANRVEQKNEIIAVRSRQLSEIQGSLQTNAEIEWLGYDVFVFGGWSLLKDGVFLKPLIFRGWERRLNDYGLLPNENLLSGYLCDYESAVKKDEVEEIPHKESVIEAIEVGRIVHQ
jgi:hypothetical protein